MVFGFGWELVGCWALSVDIIRSQEAVERLHLYIVPKEVKAHTSQVVQDTSLWHLKTGFVLFKSLAVVFVILKAFSNLEDPLGILPESEKFQ